MKCTEYFYSEKDAMDFLKSISVDLQPEITKTIDEEEECNVWIVCYNPPKMK